MICREFEEKLLLLLEGPVPREVRAALRAHAAACPACGRLFAAVSVDARGSFTGAPMDSSPGGPTDSLTGDPMDSSRGDPKDPWIGDPMGADSPAGVVPPADLLGSILDRTSGRICPRLEERLVEWVDAETASGTPACDAATARAVVSPAGRPLSPSEELLFDHLTHCPDCTALVAELRALSADLPAMAEIEPDTRFVVDVLARTSRAARSEPLLSRWGRAVTEHAGDWWERTIRRPRVALELAYVSAFALVLVFGSPSRWTAPLFPERAGRTISAAAVDFGENGRPLERLLESIDLSGTFRKTVAGPPIVRRTESLARRVGRTAGNLGRSFELLENCGSSMGRGFLRGDMGAAFDAYQEFRGNLHNIWNSSPESHTEPSSPRVRSQGGQDNEPQP